MMKKIRNLSLLLALLVLVGAVGYKIGESRANLEKLKPLLESKKLVTTDGKSVQTQPFDLSLMWEVRDSIKEKFLERDKIKDETMSYGAIEGMVAALDDPYTMFLPPKDNKNANDDLAGKFGGVGIQLGYNKDKALAVMSPISKTPAEKAGVKSGDVILRITDKKKGIDRDTVGINLNEAVELIRGEVGTEVTLKLYRESKKDTFDVILKRSNIVVPGAEIEWKEKDGKKIAWVKLYKFGDQLYEEWPGIIDAITKNKCDGIVLDLRNNPGGYLNASVMVGSDFLKDGIVVKQQDYTGKVDEYPVDTKRGKLANYKMVVLVNGGSASAAEILAGAIKEHQRAKLIGEKTFGKGTVQQPEEFEDGSGLHVTIAKWLLPSGKNIHKEGVMPDIEVKYEAKEGDDQKDPKDRYDNQLERAMEEVVKL